MPTKFSKLRRIMQFFVIGAGLKILIFGAAYLLAHNVQQAAMLPSA